MSRISSAEKSLLWFFGSAVVALHVVGWGMAAAAAREYPFLLGLAGLAYSFGLRHAFDADHIAAIDNTTRKLMTPGRRPFGVGFFFSLRHSTVVFAMTLVVALLVGTIQLVSIVTDRIPGAHAGIWGAIQNVDVQTMGYLAVGLFVVSWLASLAIWRFGRMEDRWSALGRERLALRFLFLSRAESKFCSPSVERV